MSVDVIVRQGDCPCPGHPHDAETVTLETSEDGGPTLPLAIYAYKMLANAEGNWRAKEAALIAAYIPKGIGAWTFTDRNGDPVPITTENAERLIPWDRGGYAVMEKANELYSDRVLAPFLPNRQPVPIPTPSSSQTGPKDESTSATPPPGSSLPARSRRSSRTSSDG